MPSEWMPEPSPVPPCLAGLCQAELLGRQLAGEHRARVTAEQIAERAMHRQFAESERLALALAEERQLRDEVESLLGALEAFSSTLELPQVASLLHEYLRPLIRRTAGWSWLPQGSGSRWSHPATSANGSERNCR